VAIVIAGNECRTKGLLAMMHASSRGVRMHALHPIHSGPSCMRFVAVVRSNNHQYIRHALHYVILVIDEQLFNPHPLCATPTTAENGGGGGRGGGKGRRREKGRGDWSLDSRDYIGRPLVAYT
jgi:hypothetical protein